MRTAKYPRIEDPYDSLTGSLQAKGVESFNDGWLGSADGPQPPVVIRPQPPAVIRPRRSPTGPGC